MQVRTWLAFLTTILLALSTSSSAFAADPSAGAQSQLRSAFSKCDDKNPEGYFKQRDVALSGDASLKTWAGTIEPKSSKPYPVQPTLARCDRDMGAQAAAEAKKAANDALASKVRDAEQAALRDDAKIAGYQSLRDQLAKADPSPATTTKVQGWDKEVADAKAKRVADAATAKKRAEDEAASAAARKASQDKQDAEEAAVMKSLKGDRLKIAKDMGLPDLPLEKVAKARVWQYEESVEISHSDALGSVTAPCMITYSFAGSKAQTSKKGAGCPYRTN